MSLTDYIRIEYSGYINFPSGNYANGSKSGQPISGVFDVEYIDLNSVSNLDYQIDPGKIGYPSGVNFSFDLLNEDFDTGEKIFDFLSFSGLGRTEEYGGNLYGHGDIFIRVYSPIYGNKKLYEGVVSSFKFTPYDKAIQINCESFVSAIKGSELKPFESYELGEGIVKIKESPYKDKLYSANFQSLLKTELLEIRRVSKLSNLVGMNESFKNTKIGDTPYDRERDVTNFFKDNKPKIMSIFGNSPLIDRWKIYDYMTYYNEYMGGSMWVRESLSQTVERYSIDLDVFMNSAGKSYLNYFCKIGESTILTQLKVNFKIAFDMMLTPYDGGPVSGIRIYEFKQLETNIEVIHANNGNKTSYISGEKTTILERGRFFKESNNIEEVDIKDKDIVNVSLVDFARPSYNFNEQYFKGAVDETFTEHGYDGGCSIKDGLFIHGVLFDEFVNGTHIASSKGYFNSFISFVSMLNKLVSDRYSYSGAPFSIFNYSEVPEELYQHCFVSDLVHYKWGDKSITDLIVDYSSQISCYVFINEDGKIEYKPREIDYHKIDTEVGFLKEVYSYSYNIDGGKTYDYASKYYEYSFQDNLEINNLMSDAKIERVINNDGELSRTDNKPKKISVELYRTSDLGVPSSNEIFEGAPPPMLRSAPGSYGNLTPINYMLRTPDEQASAIVKGIKYPSSIFSIALDVINNVSKYKNISLGSLVDLTDFNVNNEFKNVHFVKRISYNISQIYKTSLATKLELMFVARLNNPGEIEYDATALDLFESGINPSIEGGVQYLVDAKDDFYITPPFLLTESIQYDATASELYNNNISGSIEETVQYDATTSELYDSDAFGSIEETVQYDATASESQSNAVT